MDHWLGTNYHGCLLWSVSGYPLQVGLMVHRLLLDSVCHCELWYVSGYPLCRAGGPRTSGGLGSAQGPHQHPEAEAASLGEGALPASDAAAAAGPDLRPTGAARRMLPRRGGQTGGRGESWTRGGEAEMSRTGPGRVNWGWTARLWLRRRDRWSCARRSDRCIGALTPCDCRLETILIGPNSELRTRQLVEFCRECSMFCSDEAMETNILTPKASASGYFYDLCIVCTTLSDV